MMQRVDYTYQSLARILYPTVRGNLTDKQTGDKNMTSINIGIAEKDRMAIAEG